jgi:asparagine synthase (glutamine-hydrolysing)
MCGISGIIRLSGKQPLADWICRMTSCLRHRGGDDEGYALIDRESGECTHASGDETPEALQSKLPHVSTFHERGFDLALGHVRFSIVDPSTAGHQPFMSGDGSCCASFNGEIYNHAEIRRELEAEGVRFRTTCDTEALVEAYVRWGTDCFKRFNGFWAVAIYDRRSGEVLLSRDRVGKKQIYWCRLGDVVLFASEIKALRSIEQVRRISGVNECAAHEWLVFGRRDWSECTMFEGIYRLPAATWCVVDSRFPSNANRFWSLPNQRLSERRMSVVGAVDELRALLSDAVRVRMIADCPAGVELSGGLDSSVLAWEAAKHAKGRISTYTVRVPERRWDESHFAQSAARSIGSDHHVLLLPESGFWRHAAEFVALHEEPVHSPNLFSNQAIWSAMRSDGFRVSLNGAAGDELLAGYSSYFHGAQRTLLRQGRYARVLSNAYGWTESPPWRRPVSLARLFPTITRLAQLWRRSSASAQRPWLRTAAGDAFMLDRESEVRGISEMLTQDMTERKMPYWLVSGDKNYMGLPIEVRAPFLDYRVVEFAFRLPESYLIRDGWHKWILRRAYAGLLPDNVVWRRRKLGFPIGLDSMLGQSREIVRQICELSENPFVDLSRVECIQRDWRTLSFVLWFEYHIRGNRSLFDRLSEMAPASDVTSHRPRYWNLARRS